MTGRGGPRNPGRTSLVAERGGGGCDTNVNIDKTGEQHDETTAAASSSSSASEGDNHVVLRWQLVGWPVRPVEPCLAPARLLLCVVPPPATSTTTISGWRRHRDSRRLFARRSTPTTFLGGRRDTREIRLSLLRDGSSRRPRYSNGTAICSGWNNPTPGGRICSCHLLDQIMVLDDESCQQPTHRIRLRTDHMNRFPSPHRHRNLCRFPSGS